MGGEKTGSGDQAAAGAQGPGRPTPEARTTFHATSHDGPLVGGDQRARLIGRLPMCQVRGTQGAKLRHYPMQRLTVAPWWVGIKRARLIRRLPVHQVRGARRAKPRQDPIQRLTAARPSASRGTADTARDNTLNTTGNTTGIAPSPQPWSALRPKPSRGGEEASLRAPTTPHATSYGDAPGRAAWDRQRHRRQHPIQRGTVRPAVARSRMRGATSTPATERR
jgi:hypothetical protein